MIVFPSSPMACLRQFLPVCDNLSNMESVTAWPDSDVPAARKVTGVRCFLASLSRDWISRSVSTFRTIFGINR